MKNSPTAIVQGALDTFANLNQDADALRLRLPAAHAELENLSVNGDLNDDKVLSSIARLQTFTALLPTRIAAREAAVEQAQKDLLSACHSFISTGLRQRLNELLKRARAKVQAVLENHLQGDELSRAIEKSNEVAEIESLECTATIRNHHTSGDEVVRYARQLIDCWHRAEAISAKI